MTATAKNRKSAKESEPPSRPNKTGRGRVAPPDHLTEAIELLFFAYRDFTSDPDVILAEYDFGRAHHRVIHFVGRNPGITVAELLNILRITKQSLARVLKQLIERGFIEQETGRQDRRQRLLYLTEKGVDLEQMLEEPQRQRLMRAFESAGVGSEDVWRAVQLAMVNEEERSTVEHLIASGPTDDE